MESKDESLNKEGSLVLLLPRRWDGEIGQLLLLGTCFQLWLQTSSLCPCSLLAMTCPLVQRLEQERRWAVGDHSRFAVLGSLQPCACACSSSLPTLPPVMGQEANVQLCLQLAYLLHSPATLHLFRCCSGVHMGEIFSCLSIPEEVWVAGAFYYYFGKRCPTSYFIFLWSASVSASLALSLQQTVGAVEESYLILYQAVQYRTTE